MSCALKDQLCDGTKCPANINTHYQFIRPCYCSTSYFNKQRPDAYTYLQYWRRRMCYMNYLQYFGVLPSDAKQWPNNGKPNPMLKSCPRPFNVHQGHQVPYVSGGVLCKQ